MNEEELFKWYPLRDFVLDAVHDKKLSLELVSQDTNQDLISLVKDYLATNEDDPINKAAKIVAYLAPGVSSETANQQPWLVLEKS